MFRYLPILFITVMLSCSTAKEKEESYTSEKPRIAVVNYPLYYFAKSIGGDLIKVYLPAIDGDPAYWKPDARQVNNFQGADLILANGAGYARWMEKVSLPSSKIINTSAGFKNQWIETTEGLAHSHGPEGEHVHKGTAFTTWLNFDFARQQASVVYQELVKLLPEKVEEIKNNYELIDKELAELDSKMKTVAKQLDGEYVIASHPVYQYLESAYGLNMISLHWEPEAFPGNKEWKNLQHLIEDHDGSLMIWEAEPSTEIKTKLNELNLSFTVFSPCANKPSKGDFYEIMKENISMLEEITLK